MTERNFHPAYRPDIDGLRAVAIASVVAYHAFPGAVPSGYAGVDVFFVISGYLISSIIFRSLQRGDFGFAEFYRHRIVRIFPALLLVLAASLAFGWFALLPHELRQLGKHVAAGAGFVQNIVLTREAGYFDSASELKPLMHLWSLAIEEQFYLVYPLFIWGAWRLRLGLRLPVLAAGLLSLVVSAMDIGGNDTDAFFLSHTRFWELMAGAFLASMRGAAGEMPGEARRRLAHTTFATLGVALLAIAFFGIPRDAWFPGWWALVPTGGTFLLILAGPPAWPNRLLAARPMVFVGLISYPLYLWHWPLLSFARIVESEVPSLPVRLAAVGSSVALAWLTYRFIEKPVQSGPKGWTKTLVLAAAMFGIGCAGYALHRSDGLPARAAARLNGAIESGRFYRESFRRAGCGESAEQARLVICQHDPRGSARFAILGDSKADALAAGVFGEAGKAGYWLYLGGDPRVAPALPVLVDARGYRWVRKTTRTALDILEEKPAIEVVVLTAATRMLFVMDSTTSIEALPESPNYGAALEGLDRVVREIVDSGRKVVLTVDNPTFLRPEDCMRRKVALPVVGAVVGDRLPAGCGIAYDRHLRLTRQYRRLLDAVAAKHPGRVFVFDTLPYLCDIPNNACSPSLGGRFLYSYSDHLSEYGAHLVARNLVPFVESLAAPAK